MKLVTKVLHSLVGLSGVFLVALAFGAQEQPVRCEDARDQLAEHLQLVHNERVAKESQIAALSVAVKRLEAENGQLKAELKKYKEKKSDVDAPVKGRP